MTYECVLRKLEHALVAKMDGNRFIGLQNVFQALGQELAGHGGTADAVDVVRFEILPNRVLHSPLGNFDGNEIAFGIRDLFPHEIALKPLIFDFAAQVGLTKHLGSVEATEQLVELCHPGEGAYVLDVGCAAGFGLGVARGRPGREVIVLDGEAIERRTYWEPPSADPLEGVELR